MGKRVRAQKAHRVRKVCRALAGALCCILLLMGLSGCGAGNGQTTAGSRLPGTHPEA